MSRRNPDPYRESQPVAGAVSCGTRAVIFLVALTLLFSALFIVYRRWETAPVGEPIRLEEAATELNFAERFLLQNQLSNKREALLGPAGDATGLVTFKVASGESATQIAANLREEGLLREDNRALFLEYLRYYGLDAELHAGTFTLDPTLNIPNLTQTLTGSGGTHIELGFFPGWRIEEIANNLAVTRPANIDADQFLDIAYRRVNFDTTPYSFLSSISAETSFEGYLYPGIYSVPVDADAAYLVNAMLERFGQEVTPTFRQRYGEQGLSIRDAVIIASIVQREAPDPTERATVASVYLNRVAQGMKLDADPTVQYAVGYFAGTDSWWKVPLSATDLQINSPYNTYLNTTMPPGPIANPDRVSLEAVAYPEQTDYFYFVASCAPGEVGRHRFSITYDEHLEKVQACR